MPSSAMSAQRTKLFIETGVGGAKPMSVIFAGNPTIIRCVSHNQNNGNVTTLSGIIGTISAALNGIPLTITNTTSDTFAVQVDTTGLVYDDDSNALSTPVLYTKVNNLKKFNGFDGSASELDGTDLDSEAKEIRLGLQDFGKIGFDLNPNFSDPGQNAVRAAKASGLGKNFQLKFPNNVVASFLAFVKSAPIQGGVDEIITGSTELRISGVVDIV